MTGIQKNKVYTVEIQGCASNGYGVARISGQVVFVKGGLPGEVCDIKIIKAGKSISYGKIEKIITVSPHRSKPACGNYGKCGSCGMMHMDYEQELELKLTFVQDAIKRIGGLDIEVESITGSDKTERYRNKSIYAVGQINNRTVTGFFRDRSHDIVPTDTCIIQAEVSDRAAAAVRTWMDECSVPVYDEKLHRGVVRHVFCRYAFKTGMAQATIVSATDVLPYQDRLIALIREYCPETESIILNINKNRGNTVLAGEFRTLWGHDSIEDELCGLRFKLSPRSFYQVNRNQAEKLYEQVLEYAALTGSETVLDLYCGIGTITLCLAKNAKKVIGAEIVESAIEDARENALLNGVENAEFICADAHKAAEMLASRKIHPQVVVVDPPRKGLAPDVIAAVVGFAPERVVYVSCNPATLARDLKLFADAGYTAEKASAFDMFPRCPHVETIVMLSYQKEKY